MNKGKVVLIAVSLTVTMAACSNNKEEQAKPEKVTVTSPVEYSEDPEELALQQQGLVKEMLADKNVSYENLVGEAMRRGVELTEEELNQKRIQTQ